MYNKNWIIVSFFFKKYTIKKFVELQYNLDEARHVAVEIQQFLFKRL